MRISWNFFNWLACWSLAAAASGRPLAAAPEGRPLAAATWGGVPVALGGSDPRGVALGGGGPRGAGGAHPLTRVGIQWDLSTVALDLLAGGDLYLVGGDSVGGGLVGGDLVAGDLQTGGGGL